MNEWASKWFESHETEKACSPLRKNSEHEFSFLHKSIQECVLGQLHIATQMTELVLQGDEDEDQDEDEKRSPLGNHLHDASDAKQAMEINNTMNVEQKKMVNSWHRRLENISNLKPGDASDGATMHMAIMKHKERS